MMSFNLRGWKLYHGCSFSSCSARLNVAGESVSLKKIANTATPSSVMPKCWAVVCISAIFLGVSRNSTAFSFHFNWFLKQVHMFVADTSNLNSVRSDFSDRNAKITNTSSISVECKPPACREYGLHKIWRDVDILLWPWHDLHLDVWPWPY